MRLICMILTLLMTVALTACGTNSSSDIQNVPASKVQVSSSEIAEQPSSEVNKYDSLLDLFTMPIDDLGISFNKADAEEYISTWEDTDGSWSVKRSSYIKNSYIYEIVSNEDFSRNEVQSITLTNPDVKKFYQFLNTQNWYPDNDSSMNTPNGYILTADSVIFVDCDESTQNNFSLYNVKALADILGIDIQKAVSNVSSMDDAIDISTNLIMSLDYGVRGYESYLKINPNGVIIDDYDDLVYALNHPFDTQLGRVQSSMNEFYNTRNEMEEYYTGNQYDDDVPPADDSIIDDYQKDSDNSAYDYALDPSAGYDFNHEPENWGELVDGFNALNENLINHFWDIADSQIG